MPVKYVKIGPAFFAQTPTGLAAVADPATLRGLMSGQIPAETRAIPTEAAPGERFAPGGQIYNPPFSQEPRDVFTGAEAGEPDLGSQISRTPLVFPQDTYTPQTSSVDLFNLKLLDLLKGFQGLGTGKFQQAEFAAREAQAGRVFQTPSELIGAAPSLQAQARGAAVGALQPTISGYQEGAQTFAEQIRAFGNSLEFARGIGQMMQEQENAERERVRQAQEDARKAVEYAFDTFGGEAFAYMDPTEITALERRAGLPRGYIVNRSKTIKERELEQKQQTGDEATTNLKEYQFAVNQGFTGSFMDFLKAKQTIPASILLQQGQIDRLLTPQEAADFGVPYGTMASEVRGLIPLGTSERAKLSDKASALATLAEVEKISQRVNTFGPGFLGINRLIEGGQLAVGALAQTNPDAAQLIAQKGILATIIRGLGEKGTLATADVERALALIPGLTTTEEVARRNLQEIRNILEASQESVIGTAGVQVKPAQENDPLNVR